jgi:ABC-type polysaccharide/polyol phosphate export permease
MLPRSAHFLIGSVYERSMHPFRAAFRLPLVVVRHHELLMAFVRRELRARIEGSALGRVWPVIQPAVLFAIYYLVFARILKIGFSDELAPHGPDGEGWRSTFYLITGILPWTVLAESLSRGSGVVLENANLVKKIAFPSELLPVYTVVVNHVYLLIGYALLVAMEWVVNGSLPIALVWLPAIFVVQFLFISGLAMFLSAANIFVRDVMQLVPVVVIFWMFTTPVFYDLNAVATQAEKKVEWGQATVVALEADPLASPALLAETMSTLENDRASAQDVNRINDIMQINPMATVLSLHRSIWTYGKVPMDVGKLLRFGLLAVVVQFLGYAFFLRCKGRFSDEV